MSLSDAEDAAEEAETIEETREAASLFEEIAERSIRTAAFALTRAAEIAQRTGDVDLAEARLRKSVRILSKDSRAQCQLGLLLLNRGIAPLEEIESCFRASVRAAASSDELGVSYAVVARHQLALIYAQTKRQREADAQARALKFRWKLSPAVWTTGQETMTTKTASSLPPACFVDDLLPTDVFARVRECFAPDSPFWTEHGYPTETFFSYYEPFARRGSNNVVRTIVERFVLPAVVRRFPRCDKDRLAGYEFWAHSRPNGQGHHMHYDTDELGIRSKKIRHPAVSCVFTIERGHGGATLVCDHRLNDDDDAFDRGWLLSPKKNRLAFFDGSLLHGVLPCLRRRTSDDDARPTKRRRAVEPSQRITLMIGLWTESPCSTTETSETSYDHMTLSPCMALPQPHATTTPTGLTWPALFRSKANGATGTGITNTRLIGGRTIEPVYVRIEDGKDDDVVSEEALGSVALVGDFFLRSLDDTDKRTRMSAKKFETTTSNGTSCEWESVD
eukprot:g3588.t1